jgi:putative transposase
VSVLCARHGVTRSGYYAWRRRQASAHAHEDKRLTGRIQAIFDASHGTYGSPRIHAALQQAGIPVSCKRVARLMRESNLKAKASRLHKNTPGNHQFFLAISNKLLGRMTESIDEVWVGDVTYLKVSGQWRYLAVVMDRHSRRVLSWGLAPRRDMRLTLSTFNLALMRRRPKAGLIFHSDRGIEYGAYGYRARLASLGIIQSMNRPRQMNDNAYMESFFHSLKTDVIHGLMFDDEGTLSDIIRDYIRRYNRSRLHSSLGYRSPIDYEKAAA